MTPVKSVARTKAKTAEVLDPEHDVVQSVVREAVRTAMDSPLREPILEGVADAQEVDIDDPAAVEASEGAEETPSSSVRGRLSRGLRGLTALTLLVGLGYVAIRRLRGRE